MTSMLARTLRKPPGSLRRSSSGMNRRCSLHIPSMLKNCDLHQLNGPEWCLSDKGFSISKPERLCAPIEPAVQPLLSQLSSPLLVRQSSPY